MKQISSSEIKTTDFFEVIIPFQGQIGVGGNLPKYLEQGNCDILPNKSGLLIQKEVFLELIDQTLILEDFNEFYFYINPDISNEQDRFNMDYSIKSKIQADYCLIPKLQHQA